MSSSMSKSPACYEPPSADIIGQVEAVGSIPRQYLHCSYKMHDFVHEVCMQMLDNDNAQRPTRSLRQTLLLHLFSPFASKAVRRAMSRASAVNVWRRA